MGITINDVTARQRTVATAGQTVFTVPFRFFADTDLQVYKNGVLKTLSTHYTVQGADALTGMQVTLLSAAALNDVILIIRAVPYENTTEFALTGPFNVAALNTFGMKLVALIQQVRDAFVLSLRLGDADVDGFGSYDANNNRIRNLPDAVEDDEPVTYGQVLATVGSADDAADSAAAALVSQVAAESAKDTAISMSGIAAGHATEAASQKVLAQTAQTAAAASATAAATSASGAATSATDAATSLSTLQASFAGTSVTSLLVGTGSKVFTTQSGKAWTVGQRLRASNSSGTNVMEGAVTAYSGTSLTINVDYTAGSGTLASWDISVTGERGATGPSGAGTGDVVGPASSVDNRIALFSGTGGKLLKVASLLISEIATLASPIFTGTPAAPTAAADTNTTQLATTAFVVGQAGSTSPAINGSAAVGTSKKYARDDHVHPTDTSRAAASHTHAQSDVTNLVTDLAAKAPLASPALTGTPTIGGTAIGTAALKNTGTSGANVPLLNGANTWSGIQILPDTSMGAAAPHIILEEQQASGVSGGTFTSGADQVRVLNTEVRDVRSECSLASNQFTLAAGTYYIEASAPARSVDGHIAMLWNATAASELLRGETMHAAATGSVMNRSEVSGVFTVAASQALEIRHRCSTTVSSNGLGISNGFGTNRYTRVKIWRIA